MDPSGAKISPNAFSIIAVSFSQLIHFTLSASQPSSFHLGPLPYLIFQSLISESFLNFIKNGTKQIHSKIYFLSIVNHVQNYTFPLSRKVYLPSLILFWKDVAFFYLLLNSDIQAQCSPKTEWFSLECCWVLAGFFSSKFASWEPTHMETASPIDGWSSFKGTSSPQVCFSGDPSRWFCDQVSVQNPPSGMASAPDTRGAAHRMTEDSCRAKEKPFRLETACPLASKVSCSRSLLPHRSKPSPSSLGAPGITRPQSPSSPN